MGFRKGAGPTTLKRQQIRSWHSETAAVSEGFLDDHSNISAHDSVSLFAVVTGRHHCGLSNHQVGNHVISVLIRSGLSIDDRYVVTLPKSLNRRRVDS